MQPICSHCLALSNSRNHKDIWVFWHFHQDMASFRVIRPLYVSTYRNTLYKLYNIIIMKQHPVFKVQCRRQSNKNMFSCSVFCKHILQASAPVIGQCWVPVYDWSVLSPCLWLVSVESLSMIGGLTETWLVLQETEELEETRKKGREGNIDCKWAE